MGYKVVIRDRLIIGTEDIEHLLMSNISVSFLPRVGDP